MKPLKNAEQEIFSRQYRLSEARGASHVFFLILCKVGPTDGKYWASFFFCRSTAKEPNHGNPVLILQVQDVETGTCTLKGQTVVLYFH